MRLRKKEVRLIGKRLLLEESTKLSNSSDSSPSKTNRSTASATRTRSVSRNCKRCRVRLITRMGWFRIRYARHLVDYLFRQWIRFKDRHGLGIETSLFTWICATLGFGFASLCIPIVLALIYVPQPYTSIVIYGSWPIIGLMILKFAQWVAKQYQ